MTDLAGTCGNVARQQKRKTMQVQDIVSVSSYVDKFHFIKDSKLPAMNPRKNEENQIQKEAKKIVEEAGVEETEMQ